MSSVSLFFCSAMDSLRTHSSLNFASSADEAVSTSPLTVTLESGYAALRSSSSVGSGATSARMCSFQKRSMASMMSLK